MLITSLTNVAVDNPIERILELRGFEIREHVPRTGHPAKMNHGRGPAQAGVAC
jgi:hypothetical protein